jgi:hypothetical protein
MPIRPFLANQAFDPELIETMSAVFVETCNALGLADRADPMNEVVAAHIIKLAQCGIRTKTALYLATIKEFKAKPQ